MKINHKYVLATLGLGLGLLTGCTWDKVEPDVCFESEVLPIFVTYCSTPGCHNSIDREEDYDLTSYAGIMQGAPARLAPRDSGLLLGLASIVLGFLQLWVIGLPLAIVSLVRSHKTKVSSTFGIIGVVINVFILGVSVFRVAASLSTYPGAQDHTG